MPEVKLTKKEKKELRKLEWQEKALKEEKQAKIKKYSIWAGAALLIILVIAGLIWLVNSPSTSSTDSIKVAPVSKRDFTNGDIKAKVTLIEYSDFQCPACAAYYPVVKQLLAEEKDKIYYIYRMFPLTNIHPNSHISAQAAYAAHKQGKFFEMMDILFTKQNDWAPLQDPRPTFIDYAKTLKLDIAKFTTDMNSDEAKKFVNDSENEANNEGINATPTFIVNGVKITNPSSYDDFKKLIETEYNKK